MSSSPAYSNDQWADEYWRLEHDAYVRELVEGSHAFQPDVLWRDRPRRSKYVNVSTEGLRHTINYPPAGSDQTKSVFLFGGSAMFGAGVPDQYTIASLLSRLLNRPEGRTYYQVTNWGTNAFTLEQDFKLFVNEARNGNRPAIAVFYNGANDAYASVFSPGKTGWYLNAAEIESRLLVRAPFFRPLLFHYGKQAWQIVKTAGQRSPREGRSAHYMSDYSNRAAAFVTFYTETVRMIDSLCGLYGVRCYFFVQPYLLAGDKPLEEFEGAMVSHPSLLAVGSFDETEGMYQARAMRAAYDAMENLKAQARLYNLFRIFDRVAEPIYIDHIHLSAAGNSAVAKRMAQVIF